MVAWIGGQQRFRVKNARLTNGNRRVTRGIEPIEKPLRIHRMVPAADVFPKTLKHVEGKQLPEFLRKSHPGNDAATVEQTSSERK